MDLPKVHQLFIAAYDGIHTLTFAKTYTDLFKTEEESTSAVIGLSHAIISRSC